MSAVKVKVVQTTFGTQVTIDGKAAYDTDNSAEKEKRNLQHLLKHIGLDEATIEVEAHSLG